MTSFIFIAAVSLAATRLLIAQEGQARVPPDRQGPRHPEQVHPRHRRHRTRRHAVREHRRASSIEAPAALARSDRSFALRIVGNPLPGSGLADGDFLIAQQSDTADGQGLLIAAIDGRTRLTNVTTAGSTDATIHAVATGMLRVYTPKES